MTGRSNHEAQVGDITNVVEKGVSSNKMTGSILVKRPRLDMHTPGENIFSKVRIEVDNVLLTVESRVQEAVLTAIETLLIPRVELTKKLVNVTSGRSADGDVLELDQRSFSGNIERLEMTASSRVNSRTD